MDQTNIKYQRMEENINSLYNVSNEIEAILDNIKNTFNKTINESSWNSEASKRISEDFNEFTNTFNEFEENIARSIIYLTNTLDSYYETDKELKQNIADKFYFKEEIL